MEKQSVGELAAEYFASGYNCAESVLRAVSRAMGEDGADLSRIATGFGAGIGYWGEVCGSLTGAVMALGLKYGRRHPGDTEAKRRLYEMSSRLLEDFQTEFGEIRCLSLTGCNMRTPEGLAKFQERDLHHTLCPKFVAFVAERTMQIIEETQSGGK